MVAMAQQGWKAAEIDLSPTSNQLRPHQRQQGGSAHQRFSAAHQVGPLSWPLSSPGKVA